MPNVVSSTAPCAESGARPAAGRRAFYDIVRRQDVETPFKASVNGIACIVHAGDAGLRIEHGSGCRHVSYGAVRCVQRDGRRLTLNAELDGKLVLYSVEARGARKLYELVLSGCSSENSGAESGVRNSNRQADPSSSHDSANRSP